MGTPTFNFKLTAVVKKRKSKNSGSIPSGSKKLIGVVRIDLDAHYFVRVYKSLNEFQDCEISSNSITCKGKEVVYKFEKNSSEIIQWIRSRQPLHVLDYHWKPFKPGSVVKGYINHLGVFEIVDTRHIGFDDFYIKELNKSRKEHSEDNENDIITDKYILYDNDIEDARHFYKDNATKIKKSYQMRYGTTE